MLTQARTQGRVLLMRAEKGSTIRLAGAIAMAMALVGVPGVASARAPQADVPLAQTLQGPAKDAYSSASLLFNNGDFAGAFTKYGAAYDLAKDPRLLYNMALCEKNTRHYAQMQVLLLRYERESGPTLSAEHKDAVDGALAAIRNLVSTVQVTSNVVNSVVSVDGETVGTTPLKDPLLLDLGKHSIVVDKSGFEPVTNVVDVTGNDTRSVAVTLVARQHVGRLVVAAEPGSTILVDGTLEGTERLDKGFAAGQHEVRVTSPGKVPFQSDLEIHDGETRMVEVSLSSEPHGATVWPWVVGGVAVAAGAAVGGYFLFKPTDTVNPIPHQGNDPYITFGSVRAPLFGAR